MTKIGAVEAWKTFRGDKAFIHTRENPEGTWIDWVERIDGDWEVTFRHIPYDHDAMAELARQNGQPELASALATGWIR